MKTMNEGESEGDEHIWNRDVTWLGLCNCPVATAQGSGRGHQDGEAGSWSGQQRGREEDEIRLGTGVWWGCTLSTAKERQLEE